MKIKKGCTLWARQTLESEIFYYKPDKWFKIWFFIVNSVNHKDTKLFKRGEGLITYEDISRKTKATRTQIEKCLKWMKKDGMIDERRTTRGNIKIILKYGVFQEMKTYQKTGETNDETITRRTRDDKKAVPIDKNDKNEKNEKNEKIINIPFSTFWNLYDYKKSKPIAEKKWNSLTDEEREKVIEALPDYIASTNKNGKYPPRKYPTTYLNQEGWEDEIIKGRGIIDYDAMGLTK